ncbi:MAG: hypothetical protein KGL53_01370, partial [Elusimicrobia bacterium]|nr:hypothetical protein [Elusimicrobiota bacterium]
SAIDLGGNTTAWFNAASSYTAPSPGNPGAAQAILANLEGGYSYWFGIRSVDAANLTSLVDDKTRNLLSQVKVDVKGIAGVTDLTAFTGTAPGTVDLVWTTPNRIGQTDPTVFDVRVSSAGQIANPAQFDAALPLTAFSPSTVPGVAAAGSSVTFTVTGLAPGTTYYFAVRGEDAGTPPFKGLWQQGTAGRNLYNFAPALFLPGTPEAVTDLTALPGARVGDIALEWTAPHNKNLVALDHYQVVLSTLSVTDLGGNATNWFNLSGSTSFVVAASSAPGGRQTASISVIPDLGHIYYAGLRAVDAQGEVGPIDAESTGAVHQARSRARPTPPIINLTAVAVSTESGRVDLTWTSPDTTGLVLPLHYDIRASTAANIPDNATADADALLSAFSASPTPAVSSATATQMEVTGLVPLTTYYFAVRVVDSNPFGSVVSEWVRSIPQGLNINNFAAAPLVTGLPDAVTDLTAVPGAANGQVDLTWTAPRNGNFVPVTGYEVRYATFSAAELGGDTTAWYLAASSAVAVSTPAAPGSRLTLTLSGLEDADRYFVVVKSTDAFGEVSPADASVPQVSARARGVGPVTDLTAFPDTVSGAVSLVWTAPYRVLDQAPERYRVVMSTAGQIASDAAFAAASPLSAFSLTPVPSVSTGGAHEALTVTGLQPFTTYYFALRVEDSSAPLANLGAWQSGGGRNLRNFTAPAFVPQAPAGVTDLSTLPGPLSGELELTWTAPPSPSFVPISSYTIRAATFPAAGLAGGATQWFSQAPLSYVYYPAHVSGSAESIVLSGLQPGAQYFFGLQAF